MKTSLAILLISILAVGCNSTRYGTVNGMSYCKNCRNTVALSGSTEKVTLPSGGGGGVTVNLGSLEKTDTMGQISKTRDLVNEALVASCEGQKSAAFANDRAAYSRWNEIAQNQIVKLQQLEDLMVQQEGGNTTTSSNTQSPTKPTVAKHTATAGQGTTKAKKWAAAYSPKAETARKLKLPPHSVSPSAQAGGPIVTGSSASAQAAPTPPVVSAAVKAVLQAPPAKNAALGISPGN